MGRFLLRRFGQMLIVLLMVTIISFSLIHLAPGNPALMLVEDGASAETIAAMERYLGLDKPLTEQYWIYLKNILKGDLGTSITYKLPCAQLIYNRLGSTFLLAVCSMIVAILVSIPMGMLAGIKQGSVWDILAMLFALVGQSISAILLAMLLIYVFATKLQWLPSFGYSAGEIKYAILPAITLGYGTAAQNTRLLRSGIIDVKKEDYIISTRAKGIPEWKINFKYTLRNALLPVALLTGLQFGHLLGGSVVAEQVFSWPGLGALTVQAINMRDYPLIQSILLIVSAMYVLVNILIDIINSIIDPRITLN